jgi:hypothetical protein
MSTAVASPARTKVGDSGNSSPTPVVSVRNAAAPNGVQMLTRPINQAAVIARNPVGVQASLRLSAPNDPAEKEAAVTARKIMRMQVPESSVSYLSTGTGGLFRAFRKEDRADKLRRPEPAIRHSANPLILTKRPEEERKIQRQAESQSPINSNVAANIQSNMAVGTPLPMTVRKFMEPRFGADFSGVRIHTGSESASLNRQLNAQAFALNNHIFFGKDKLNPESHEGKELIAHELTHTIQQGAAVQRSEEVSVRQQTPPQVQRLGISDALNYFADKANLIPGFRMFTIILGVNPINMSGVDRSAANILRALVEFIPGGGLIVEALDNNGIFDKVGNWVEQQIKTLGMTGSAIKQAVIQFLDSLSWSDIFHLGEVWDRAKRIFTEPIDRIIGFAKGLVTGIITFIKDAILMPLAKLAEGTRGWDLLIAVLGRNPITGEAVPRTAETLIPGFLKLIGQEEVWENMKKANALGRAWAWFQGAMNALMGFVSQIPTLAMNTFKSLELFDIVVVPRAFAKVAAVFGNFIGNFITWAGTAVWNLLEIIFDVVSPGAFAYVKKTGAALKSILKTPLPFVGNLVKAAKLGFQNFAGKFLSYLKAGLIEWLTGSLSGVYIPQALTLAEIGKFALSVLGITWAQIRGKIVKALGPTGEKIMSALETGFDVVVALVKGGPAAAWEVIKDKLTTLKDQVISGITGMVVDIVVTKAIPKLLAMFIPGAGFISAIISIYDTIMVFVQKISKIIQVVTGFIDSIVAIAGGAIGAAASRVEGILAGLLSLAINFLAGFFGAGKITDKVMGVIKKVQAVVDKAIDAAINWIVGKAKALFGKLFGKKEEENPEERLRKAVDAIRPDAEAMLSKGARGLLFKAKLLAWKIRYRLSSLEVSDGNLVARINPVAKIAKVVVALADNIRVETHAAAVEISQLPEVRRGAADVAKQKKSGLGTTSRPIVVDPRGGLLGASVAQQRGLATKPFEETTFQIPGAAAPITTKQMFSPGPSSTIVNPRGSAVHIGTYADYADHLKARGLSDADVRVGVALLMAGQRLPAKLAPHEAFIAPLTFLLASTEPARIPSQAAALSMAVQQPPSTGLPQSTPAYPKGAVGANKEADVRAGVPGATSPSKAPEEAVVQEVIRVQLERTEGFIISQMQSGGLVFSSDAALKQFIKKDLRGQIKENMIQGFRLKG